MRRGRYGRRRRAVVGGRARSQGRSRACGPPAGSDARASGSVPGPVPSLGRITAGFAGVSRSRPDPSMAPQSCGPHRPPPKAGAGPPVARILCPEPRSRRRSTRHAARIHRHHRRHGHDPRVPVEPASRRGPACIATSRGVHRDAASVDCGAAGLCERMARLEGLFEGFTRRARPAPPA